MLKTKLHITPTWLFRNEENDLLDPVIFALLNGVHDTGKLTRAAQKAGISYRHAWNLLTRGELFFGMPMVTMRKGYGTRLSPLGEQLLWSEQRLRARLEPQLDSMASELNHQLQQLLEGAHPVLRLHASHGYAVALLAELPGELDLRYCNPLEALSALNRGDCDLASFHLPASPPLAARVMAAYHDQLAGQNLRVIRFVTRRQGLILRTETRQQVHGLADLTRPGLRFINRDEHSGTRVLFNLLLEAHHIDEAHLTNAAQEEFTHTAVAAYVAAGMADVGFGVEAAAAQFGLEFINLATEHYLLVCHESQLRQHNLCQLMEAMGSDSFLSAVDHLAGYTPDKCGTPCTFDELLKDGIEQS
ncbi:substrate-binding domain-containing protein [Larsenimonas rhizosphaerae]|uniref:helix-turn-helix transcriptional regulator n=1 Tax=Larsenimonas rhizosphaerae TaxID=2944682 RepID=UPI0020342E4A|nr:substrate-binding domain-containing protein [Larsenimonas rhizosphaerae]MCM2132182.1 helix-turn-helix transcriptional regulator [Larsenimonas rhizosphaerae]